MKEYKELHDEDLDKVTGGEKSMSEYIEEMISDIQELIHLSPTTISQLRQTSPANVYAIAFRCSYWQNSPDLFYEFKNACENYGNIDYTGCYALK